MSLLPFFGNGDWAGWTSLGFCVLGSASITLAFWPGFYHTWKTKDTKFLPLGLFSLFLLVGVLMTAGSISGVCAGKPVKWLNIRSGFFIYLNAFVMLVNAYTVGLTVLNRKRENKKVAKVKTAQPKK